MDSFELNKYVASLLIALLVAMIATLVGEALVSPCVYLKQNVLRVAVDASSDAKGAAPQVKVFDLIAPKLDAANIENGEKQFKKCQQCHSIESGQNHIGPSLWSVIGRSIASVANYVYSSAIKEKSAESWDVEKLNHFLYRPKDFVKGTKMTFAGIENDQDRIDVIAYLKKKAH